MKIADWALECIHFILTFSKYKTSSRTLCGKHSKHTFDSLKNHKSDIDVEIPTPARSANF